MGDYLKEAGEVIHLYKKVIKQNDKFYPKDAQVSAKVTFGGQLPISRQSALARIGVLEPIPGSAIIQGCALNKNCLWDSWRAGVYCSSWLVPCNGNLDSRTGDTNSLTHRLNAITQFPAQNNWKQELCGFGKRR